jgi:hypothetical protein
MDKAQLKRDYKEKQPVMGVYKIEVLNTDKCFIGYATDLNARFNRHKFDLKFGSHRNRELQQNWNSYGEDAFRFVILDELEYDKNSDNDPKEELKLLLELWIEKLKEKSITFELIQ